MSDYQNDHLDYQRRRRIVEAGLAEGNAMLGLLQKARADIGNPGLGLHVEEVIRGSQTYFMGLLRKK